MRIRVKDSFKREQLYVNRDCPSTASGTGRQEARSEERRDCRPATCTKYAVHPQVDAGLPLHPLGGVLRAAHIMPYSRERD